MKKSRIDKKVVVFFTLIFLVSIVVILISDKIENNIFLYFKIVSIVIIGVFLILLGIYALIGFSLGGGLNPIRGSGFFEDLFREKKNVNWLNRFNLLGTGIIWVPLGILIIYLSVKDLI